MGMSILFGLVGSLIIFFCLTSSKTKIIALYVALGFAVFIAIGYKSPEDYKNPDKFSKEYQTMLAGQGKTLAQVGIRLSQRTPLENSGDFLIVVLVIATVSVVALVNTLKSEKSEECKKCARQIVYKNLSLLVAVIMYFLSLYAGLELTLIPWIKNGKKQLEAMSNKQKAIPV